MLILTLAQVKGILSMEECIEAVERSFNFYGKGEAMVADNRIFHQFGEGNAWSYAVAGAITPNNMAVLKALQVNWENPAKHKLPHMYGVILLYDQATGVPLALMEATHITNFRTGALAGIGAKYLAKRKSEVVAVLGARDIARCAALAVAKTMPAVKTIRVYSRTKANRELFAADLKSQVSLEVAAVENSDAAVKGADIVIVATSANEPVLLERQVHDGMFIAALGSSKEVELSVLGRVKVVAEIAEECKTHGKYGEALRCGAMREGDLFAQLVDVISGKTKGRTSDEDVFLLDSIGLATEDVAVASLVYDRARQGKVGTELEMNEGLRAW